MSRKSRREKSRRQKIKAELKKKRKVNSTTTNFIAYVLGLVSALMLIAMIYNRFFPEPASPGAPGLVSPDTTDRPSEFERVLAAQQPQPMVDYLIKMKNWPRRAELPVKFEFQRKRIAVADKLLEFGDLDETERVLAVTSKIEAVEQQYGLDFTANLGMAGVTTALASAARQYRDDANPAIARTALQADCKLRFYEFSKTGEQAQLLEAKQSMFQLLRRFSDAATLKTVRLLSIRTLEDNPAKAHEIIEEMFTLFRDSSEPQLQKLAYELHDNSILFNHDFAEFVNSRMEAGRRGRQQVTDKSLELIELPELGQVFFDTLLKVGDGLDQAVEFDLSLQIYTKLAIRAEAIKDPELKATLKSRSANAIQRVARSGDPLQFTETLIDGQSLSSRDLRGETSVFVFWSSQPNTLKDTGRLISQLVADRDRLYLRGVNRIAVCLDPLPSQEMVKEFRSANFLLISGKRSQILEEFPVDSSPYIAVMDKTGLMRSIAIQPRNLAAILNTIKSDQ